MKEETDLRDSVLKFLREGTFFAGASVPILGEADTDERNRPCVTVAVVADGQLMPGLPIKRLQIEILTQRNDTDTAVQSAWSEELKTAIDAGKMDIAELMFSKGWLLKTFSIQEAAEEEEGKRAWTGSLAWRIVLCRF